MYTLRTITQEGVETNKGLGKTYTVTHREMSYDRFREDFKEHFEKEHVADLDTTSNDVTKNIVAFIRTEDQLQPLFKNNYNFIMTESGKTFSRIK